MSDEMPRWTEEDVLHKVGSPGQATSPSLKDALRMQDRRAVRAGIVKATTVSVQIGHASVEDEEVDY